MALTRKILQPTSPLVTKLKTQNKIKRLNKNFYIPYLTFIFFDICKLVQPLNIPDIYLTLLVSHLDISGNDNNDTHSSNIQLIFLTLPIFHLDISGNDTNDVQL